MRLCQVNNAIRCTTMLFRNTAVFRSTLHNKSNILSPVFCVSTSSVLQRGLSNGPVGAREPHSVCSAPRRGVGTSPTVVNAENSLLRMQPNDFLAYLKEHKISRCFVAYDPVEKKPKASHEELKELADFFAQDKIDFREHEGVFMCVGQRSQCLLGAFVWRTARGQACGGIRLWQYPNMERYLRDGLRLALGMGVKSALAGLWAGGGKGVVAEPGNGRHLDPEFRQDIFFDYGDFLTSLNGCYVAAEDVGLTVRDLDCVHTRTRYTTCIAEDLGGSGNPSVATGKGVICAMEGALDFLNQGTLEGKTVAIQGGGNVGVVIIEGLLERNVRQIYVTDCHQKRIDDLQDKFGDIAEGRLIMKKVPLDDLSVLSYPCDILSPCALGNVLHAESIPQVKAKIICGAANNQLGSEEDNQLLCDHGITYVPDFLANRMGIVNCANETYGRLPEDPAVERHFGRDWENSIFKMTHQILKKASDDKITPAMAAMEIADRLSCQQHPIWPQRSLKIIQSLVTSGWQHGHDFWKDDLTIGSRNM